MPCCGQPRLRRAVLASLRSLKRTNDVPVGAELKTELGKRKLPTDGRKAELEARLQAADETALKRVKTVMNSVADEFMCPITQELPVDPVMAQDSKIYERWAIEEWLGKHQRSPSTGTAMGTRLLPATQVRNTIGQLVESGAIEGDKAVAWKKKLEKEKEFKDLRAKAEEGDADAMYHLGVVYGETWSEYSLREDDVQARAWYRRAAELKHALGMGAYGEYLLKGLGGEPIPALGLIHVTRAAERGSRLAAYELAMAYLDGEYGVPRDTVQAKVWLSESIKGRLDDVGDDTIEKAKKQLQKISS